MSEIENNKRALRRELRARRASFDAWARERASAEIARRVCELAEWRSAEAVFAYLSVRDEVDTSALVARAWLEGKRVAAPRVVGLHKLEWHWIYEGDALETSNFGIPEPAGEHETLVDLGEFGAGTMVRGRATSAVVGGRGTLLGATDTADAGCDGLACLGEGDALFGFEDDGTVSSRSSRPIAIALVPALAFDHSGYRIGYGGGYYDAFLSAFPGFTVGLCYEGLLQDDLASLGCLEPHDVAVDLVATEIQLLTCGL